MNNPGVCIESDIANALDVEVQLLYAMGSIARNNGKGNCISVCMQ